MNSKYRYRFLDIQIFARKFQDWLVLIKEIELCIKKHSVVRKCTTEIFYRIAFERILVKLKFVNLQFLFVKNDHLIEVYRFKKDSVPFEREVLRTNKNNSFLITIKIEFCEYNLSD